MANCQKFIIIADHSGKALDCNPAHGKYIDGHRRVHQWSANILDPYQQWTMHTDGTIRSVVDGHPWNVLGGGNDSETPIIISNYHGRSNQQFEIDVDGHIICRCSRKAIDVYGADIKNGACIQQYDKHNYSHQKFRIIPVNHN